MNNKGWIKYAITSAVGLGIVFLVLQIRGVWIAKDAQEVMQALCDAFFVSGILLLCFGALVFCSSKGSFDGLSYILHVFFVGHNWSKTNFKDKQTYREYVEEKHAKRKEKGFNPAFMVLVGLAFMAVSFVFLALYYKV